MAIVVSALIVMLFSLGLGVVLSRIARRAALNRGQTDLARRISVAGTPEQRMRTLWMAVALAVLGVMAAATGAAGAVEVLVVLSLAMAGQAAVLQVVAARGTRGSGNVAEP